jgi:excisionase family DNA binding protein
MATATARKPDTFLTIWEAADELKISERSLRTLIAAGEIRARRLGKRIVRIPRSEIDRLAAVGCSDFRSAADSTNENAAE